jgi:hypothetical protein
MGIDRDRTLTTITRTPRSRAYSTTAATSSCVNFSWLLYAPFHSLGDDFTSNGKLWLSLMCQCNTYDTHRYLIPASSDRERNTLR